MLPIPRNKIPQIHGAGVHIMPARFSSEYTQTCPIAPY